MDTQAQAVLDNQGTIINPIMKRFDIVEHRFAVIRKYVKHLPNLQLQQPVLQNPQQQVHPQLHQPQPGPSTAVDNQFNTLMNMSTAQFPTASTSGNLDANAISKINSHISMECKNLGSNLATSMDRFGEQLDPRQLQNSITECTGSVQKCGSMLKTLSKNADRATQIQNQLETLGKLILYNVGKFSFFSVSKILREIKECERAFHSRLLVKNRFSIYRKIFQWFNPVLKDLMKLSQKEDKLAYFWITSIWFPSSGFFKFTKLVKTSLKNAHSHII